MSSETVEVNGSIDAFGPVPSPPTVISYGASKDCPNWNSWLAKVWMECLDAPDVPTGFPFASTSYNESTATVTLVRRVETLNLPELPMTSKPTVYWLGAADGIDDGAELGTVEGRLDCVGSRLGNTDGLAEMVGSRLGNTDGSTEMVGSRLGNTDGATEMVGSRLGSADGSTEMVGSRLGSDEGLSDGTGLGRPEGPNVGKAEGLSDWVGAAEGKGDDMARSNCDRIELNCICKVSEVRINRTILEF